MRADIRMTGYGGQGLLWMANTLAIAATRFSGLKAAQSASYGAATRGGYSRGDVVISDEEVDYPWLIAADVLVAMSRTALQRDLPDLKPTGLLVVDSTLISDSMGFTGSTLSLPVTKAAEQNLGNTALAGVVMLGVMDQLIPSLKPGSLRKAIEGQSPARARAQNLAAFDLGLTLRAITATAAASGGRHG